MRRKNMKKRLIISSVAISLFAILCAQADTPPGFNTPIPPEIMTPDNVETSYLGTIEFSDGRPSRETADKLYDHLAYLRAVEVFLNWMPACSIEAMRLGHVKSGITKPNQVAISEQLMDSNPLFLTGNTDTVYASTILDLERDGPTVVEIPPKCGPGTVNDAFFRFVVDMGAPGPDRGQGGGNTSYSRQNTTISRSSFQMTTVLFRSALKAKQKTTTLFNHPPTSTG